MDAVKEKKSKHILQIILKIVILILALLFVTKISNFIQGLFWVFGILMIVLTFFGQRASAFWNQEWQFNKIEDFLWAITAILGIAYLIIRAFF